MSNEKGPSAEEIARAMLKVQAEEKSKSGTTWSNVLGWGGMLLLAPGGAALYVLVDRSIGSIVCAVAFVAVIVGAILGSASRSK